MERWEKKVAVVTGASAGIGEACVRALLEKGMVVVGLARRKWLMDNDLRAKLEKGQRERFYAIKCDLRIESDICNAFAWIDEHLGGVHLLINDASIVRHNIEVISENNTENLKAGIDVNVMGVTLCTREAFKSMKRQNFYGQIIFINSLIGPKNLDFNYNLYSATKTAVTAVVEVLRQELLQQEKKIQITNISPAAHNVNNVSEFPILKCDDVINAVLYCIRMPTNVLIREMTIDLSRS